MDNPFKIYFEDVSNIQKAPGSGFEIIARLHNAMDKAWLIYNQRARLELSLEKGGSTQWLNNVVVETHPRIGDTRH